MTKVYVFEKYMYVKNEGHGQIIIQCESLVRRNALVNYYFKAQPHLIQKLWLSYCFEKVGQTSRSRSLSPKLWYSVKGVDTRLTNVKYEIPISHGS